MIMNNIILDNNKRAITKAAQKYNLTARDAFEMIKVIPNVLTILLTEDQANMHAYIKTLHNEAK